MTPRPTLRRIQRPARCSIPQFVADLRRRMLRFATLQLADPHLAEDAVQEAFVGALRGSRSFAGRAAYRSWVFAHPAAQDRRPAAGASCATRQRRSTDAGAGSRAGRLLRAGRALDRRRRPGRLGRPAGRAAGHAVLARVRSLPRPPAGAAGARLHDARVRRTRQPRDLQRRRHQHHATSTSACIARACACAAACEQHWFGEGEHRAR